MNILVSPSLMCADLLHLGEEIKALEKAGVDMFHLDIMDGRFVPNFAFGEDIVKAVRKATNLPLDIHLLIYNPEKYIERFVEAGSDIITVHREACSNAYSAVVIIKKHGVKACLAINPETPLREIDVILPEISMVDIMGVNPGFTGKNLAPGIIEKIRALRELVEEKNLNLDIEIDGGVNRESVPLLVNAGVNVVVVGRQILFSKKKSQYEGVITFLKELK